MPKLGGKISCIEESCPWGKIMFKNFPKVDIAGCKGLV